MVGRNLPREVGGQPGIRVRRTVRLRLHVSTPRIVRSWEISLPPLGQALARHVSNLTYPRNIVLLFQQLGIVVIVAVAMVKYIYLFHKWNDEDRDSQIKYEEENPGKIVIHKKNKRSVGRKLHLLGDENGPTGKQA